MIEVALSVVIVRLVGAERGASGRYIEHAVNVDIHVCSLH